MNSDFESALRQLLQSRYVLPNGQTPGNEVVTGNPLAVDFDTFLNVTDQSVLGLEGTIRDLESRDSIRNLRRFWQPELPILNERRFVEAPSAAQAPRTEQLQFEETETGGEGAGLMAQNVAVATIDAEFINGDVWIGSNEGEILISASDTLVILGNDVPDSANPYERIKWSSEEFHSFIADNVFQLRIAQKDITPAEAIRIAYLRALVVMLGLASSRFAKESYNVKYSDIVRLSADDTRKFRAEKNYPKLREDGRLQEWDADAMRQIRDHFTDLVCLVAFVFRQRGHHWQKGYDETYSRVWASMQFKDIVLGITWMNVARAGLHSVYPSILDKFWVDAANDNRCNGALKIRVDVACAGTAAPRVVLRGYNDLKLVAPGIKKLLPDDVEYLLQINRDLDANRWAGSVNRNYYGAPNVRLDESRVSAIAATIMACLSYFARTSPLAESPALKRVAGGAPITGAVYSRAVGNISNRAETVDSLLALK